MIDELKKLRELTETLTGNGYLRDQAEEWEYALDAMPDYVYIIDTEYRIKFVNRLLSKRLNKHKQELYNKYCYKVTDHEGREGPVKGWPPTNLLKPARAESVYLKNMDGWFDMTRSPITTRADKLIGFICVLQDVTEKRAALKDLVAREAILDTIFNSVPIGMGLLSSRGMILSVNKFLCDLLGYAEEELVGHSIRVFYPSTEEYVRASKMKRSAIKRYGVGSLDTKFKTKNGEVLDVYLRGASIKGGDSVVFTVTDITRRKVREHRLKLNEDRLESALALSIMDKNSVDEIVEYALEEAVRLTSSDIGYIHFVDEPKNSDIKLSLFKWSKNVLPECEAGSEKHYPLSEAGCWADCVRTKKPVVHNDYNTMDANDGKRGLPDGHIVIRRHMSIPIIEDGEVVAVAGVGNKETDYDTSDLRQLNLFMNSMWDIISRKHANDQAIKNKEYFERLIKATPVGVHVYKVIDDKLILTHFNDASKKILGINPKDVLGKSMEEAFPGHNSPGGLLETYKKVAIEGGEPFKTSMYSYSDGNICGVFSVFAFQSDEDEVAVFFNDVTDQALTQKKLEESEQKYRLIAENLPDVIWTFDTDMNFTFVSPALEEHMGYKPEEWVGHNVSEFATKEDLDIMAPEVMNALSNPEFKSTTFKSRMLHKDGRNIPIEITSKPIYVNEEFIGFQGRTRVLNND